MKNQFSLEINQPCLENFNDFTPTKGGGFCNSCTKEVIDFTKMTSQEIINYFKQNAGKNICGQFNNDQLKTYTETANEYKSYSFWKIFGLACLSLFTFNTIQAQKVTLNTETTNKNTITKSITQENSIIIKGVVSDESGPLPLVSILLQGTTIGTETDFDGEFEFPKKLKKGDVLIFSYLGMENKKVIISDNHSSSKANAISVKMNSSSCMLLGKVAVKKPYKSKKKF